MASAGAAQTLTVDLASQKPGEAVTVSVPPNPDYAVHILNRIPFATYTYTALLQTKTIEPLNAALVQPTVRSQFAGAPTPPPAPAECTALETARNALIELNEEADVPKKRAALQSALDAAARVTCDATMKPLAMLALANVDHTLEDHFVLREGHVLVITITRNGSDGKPRIWTKSFDAGERGQWRTSYGFTFLPNDDERWLAQAGNDPKQFTITPQHHRSRFDFAPSVFFTWVPGWKLSQNLDVGPTAGLGFDLAAPIVFAGLSLLWNENIALVGGTVVHQRQRLSGEFHDGQVIGENLSSDKLTEKTYGVTGFFGLSFRFGSKPQGFGEKPSATTSTKKPTPQATAPAAVAPTPKPRASLDRASEKPYPERASPRSGPE